MKGVVTGSVLIFVGVFIWLFGSFDFHHYFDASPTLGVARFAIALIGSTLAWMGVWRLFPALNPTKAIGDFFHGLYRRAHAKIHGYPYDPYPWASGLVPVRTDRRPSPDDDARAASFGAAHKDAATRARISRFQNNTDYYLIVDGKRYEVGEWIEVELPPPMRHEGVILGEIIAYRCWRVPAAHGGKLVSVAKNHVWWPGAVQTIHQDANSEGVQEREDGNGFHAFKTLGCAMQYLARAAHGPGTEPVVIGAVTLWGNIMEHALGFRAEFAYPRAFFAVSSGWLPLETTTADSIVMEQGMLRDLTERYGLKR